MSEKRNKKDAQDVDDRNAVLSCLVPARTCTLLSETVCVSMLQWFMCRRKCVKEFPYEGVEDSWYTGLPLDGTVLSLVVARRGRDRRDDVSV